MIHIRTILEPSNFISRLWTKCPAENTQEIRLMSYVLRVDHEDGVLLYNTVTGQLVLLTEEEKKLIDQLPISYNSIAEELLSAHFVVPADYDECQKVVQIRNVQRKIEDAQGKDITYYTILPTTACNARCFYCFEAGAKTESMTSEIAEATIDFITKHCNGKKVELRWFGGEPTVGHKMIDKITAGLQKNNVEFTSNMISNGYLFDEEMVSRAKNQWKLTSIQITIDGTEKIYNKVKAYVGVQDNPYWRVMNNIRLLLDAGIKVSIRLNIDRHNIDDIKLLIAELKEKFSNYKHFDCYSWPVFGGVGYDPVIHDDTDNAWLSKQLLDVNGFIESCGFYQGVGQGLPVLNYLSCMADNDRTIVIGPKGDLFRCLEHFDEKNIVGNVETGITNKELYEDWKTASVYDMCKQCAFFPKCVRLKHCSEANLCYKKDVYKSYDDTIKKIYNKSKNNMLKGESLYERV